MGYSNMQYDWATAIRRVVLHNTKRLTKRAPDAGDSAHIPSLFYAFSFFWLDGFAVPAPAQVTQTVGQALYSDNLYMYNFCSI